MSFEYSGRTIPDDQAGLIALVRREAMRPLVDERRDGRPAAHLDWISGMLTVHPELVPRFEEAYRRLLAAPEPDVARAVLDQADQHPSKQGFVRLLIDAVAEAATPLGCVADPARTDGTTFLGSAVRTLNRCTNHRAPLTPAAARQLAAIDRPEDGWPESVILLLTYDFDRYSNLLMQAVDRLADADDVLTEFAAAMANAGEPLTTKGFELIGKAGGRSRDKLAECLQAFLARAEESRQSLLNSPYINELPPEAQRRLRTRQVDPWPQFAERLGVPVCAQ